MYNKNCIVFDVDKTIFFQDLHSLLIKKWLVKGVLYRQFLFEAHEILLKFLIFNFLKRRFEYFLLQFIGCKMIEEYIIEILADDSLTNFDLLKRIDRYKILGVDIFLVSAAPFLIIEPLTRVLNITAFCSKTILGLITKDLLSKKNSIYVHIEKDLGIKIRSIYSDSILDFHKSSKNILMAGRLKVYT
jgi:phosphoserine phosphatase